MIGTAQRKEDDLKEALRLAQEGLYLIVFSSELCRFMELY